MVFPQPQLLFICIVNRLALPWYSLHHNWKEDTIGPMLWPSPSPVLIFLLSLYLDKLTSYWTGKVAADERVIMFPTAACRLNETHWEAPVHGWWFEPEQESKKRKAFLRLLARSLKVSDPEQKLILNRRMRPFVVDNQSHRRPKIELAGSTFRLPKSGKNGHFGKSLILRHSDILVHSKDMKTISCRVIDDQDRNFEGTIHLVPPTGVSVISDIDDTIKITNFLKKKEFLKNTFLLEFKVVPGMAELFQQWNLKFENCRFHFVSASPYQLYEELEVFCRREGFPSATFHLKTVRVKDKTILELFADPINYKRRHIDYILKKFPDRKFLLVGDSGEKDPEIYAAIYNKYPNQVESVWIRNINNATADRMKDIPPDKWQFFGNGTELLQ
eukprot:scaffold5259_cov120-Cylindrotheca_fusiformis.AAC.1